MPSRFNAHITRRLALLLASTALSAVPAMAQDVGTAAAVNPLSQSTPPGGGTVFCDRRRVVHQERVQTTAGGQFDFCFIDKTTLNIGPNSNLVIDSFVYDASAGTGKIATSLTKGALRFVDGQLTHPGAATTITPVAAIGIRGGCDHRASTEGRGSSTILAGSVSPTAAEPPSLGARALPSRWRIGTVVPRNRSASPSPRPIIISSF